MILEPSLKKPVDTRLIVPKEQEKTAAASPEFPWVFQDMPSKFIPYGKKTFYVRPLTVPLLGRLHAVTSRKENQLSSMLDVLNNCIEGIDIRDLTPSDFKSFLFWLRINSYPRSPITLTYTSRYSDKPSQVTIKMNKGEKERRINETLAKTGKIPVLNCYDLEVVELDKTVDWDYYFNKGLRFPTMRDMELISSDLDPELAYMAKFAQYVKADYSSDNYLQAHLDKLSELSASYDLGLLEEIDSFAGLLNHGVSQNIYVTYDKFDINEYKDILITKRDLYSSVIKAADSESANPEQIILLLNSIDTLNAEIIKVDECIKDNKEFTLEEEVVEVPINLNSFFPLL